MTGIDKFSKYYLNYKKEFNKLIRKIDQQIREGEHLMYPRREREQVKSLLNVCSPITQHADLTLISE